MHFIIMTRILVYHIKWKKRNWETSVQNSNVEFSILEVLHFFNHKKSTINGLFQK